MHKDFIPATWRGTTAIDGRGFIGLSLDTENDTVRFQIDVKNAVDILESILFVLAQSQRKLSQSSKLSEMPSEPVLTVPALSQ